MQFSPTHIEKLAGELIAAYDRGETCPPATEAALREVLPPNPRCPSTCPFRVGRDGKVWQFVLAVPSHHSSSSASR